MSPALEPKILTREIAQSWLEQERTSASGEKVTGKSIDLDSFTQLEDGVAEILATAPTWYLGLDNLRTLSLDDARAFVPFEGQLCLNGIEELEPAVEDVVATFEAATLELEGLKSLHTKSLARRLIEEDGEFVYFRDCDISEAAATVFSERDAHLMLGELNRLRPAVRKKLAEDGCRLSIGKAGSLQLDDVRGLGTFSGAQTGRLEFYGGVTSISPQAAGELGGYPGTKISFAKPLKLSAEAAEGLARFGGTLKFEELQEIGDRAATHLAQAQVDVRCYSTRVAALPKVALSRHGIVVIKAPHIGAEGIGSILDAPHLEFSRLKEISLPVAKLLAERHAGTIAFPAVQKVSLSVAEALSRHRGGIAFDGLQRLSARVAGKLAQLDGFLAFRGLKEITLATARELAKHSGRLILDGLKSLPSGTAAQLRPHAGDLSLVGLQELSLRAARELSRKAGKKVLPNLRSFDAMAVLLEEDAERVVLRFQLNTSGDFV